MEYLYSLWNYLKTEKVRYEIVDYIRAAVVIAAVMAMIRIAWDMISIIR
jgi:hypothetical protein